MDPRQKREDETWAEYGARLSSMGIAPAESYFAGPTVNQFRPTGSDYTPQQLSTPIQQLQQQNIPSNVVPIMPADVAQAGMATVPFTGMESYFGDGTQVAQAGYDKGPSWGFNISPDSVGISWGVPKDLPTQDPTGGISWPDKGPVDLPVSDIVEDIIPLPGIPEGPSQGEIDVETQIDTFSELGDPTGGLAATDPNLQGVTPFSQASQTSSLTPFAPSGRTIYDKGPGSWGLDYPSNMSTGVPTIIGGTEDDAGDDFFGDDDVSGDYSQVLADAGMAEVPAMSQADYDPYSGIGTGGGTVDFTHPPSGGLGTTTTVDLRPIAAMALPVSPALSVAGKAAGAGYSALAKSLAAKGGYDPTKRGFLGTSLAAILAAAGVRSASKGTTKAGQELVELVWDDDLGLMPMAVKAGTKLGGMVVTKAQALKMMASSNPLSAYAQHVAKAMKGTKGVAALPGSLAAATELQNQGINISAADVSEMISQVDTFKDIPAAPAKPAGPTPAEIAAAAQAEKDKQAQIAAANAAANALAAANARAKTAAANRAKVAAQKAAAAAQRKANLAAQKAAARRTALARQALKDSRAAAARAEKASAAQASRMRAKAQAVLDKARSSDRGGPSQAEINAAIEVMSQVDTFGGGSLGLDVGGFDPQGGKTGSSGMGAWT